MNYKQNEKIVQMLGSGDIDHPESQYLNHYESERKANTRQSKIANDQIKPLRFLSDRINW